MNRDKLVDLLSLSRTEFEARCDAGARAVPLGDRVWCRVLEQLTIAAIPHDVSLTPHLALAGCWEPWVTLAIGRHIKPHMRCIDIGANVGYFTALMGLLGDSVLAFEPQLENLLALRRTIAVNGTKAVITDRAVGAGTAQGEITNYGDYCGGASVRKSAGGSVEIVSLDEALKDDAGKWHFCKIDAEGSEPAIWQGMQDTWTGNPDLVVCLEYCAGFYPDAAAEFMHSIAEVAQVGKVGMQGGIVQLGAVGRKGIIDTNEHCMLWLTHK